MWNLETLFATEREDSKDDSEMFEAIRLRKDRRDHWNKTGERSLWQNVSMIGALGWLIVVPMLLGIGLGRWLDRTFDSGILFSGALIFLGLVFGCTLAWQRINEP